jgi:hypothetical protein
MRVAVSAAERAAGALSAAKLEWVASTYEREGLCVLEDLLPHAMLDELAHRYDYDCAHRYVGGDQFKGGQKGPALNPAYDGNLHLQLNLPRCHPYVRPEIVSNPIIEQVAVAVLGGACYIRYINGNSALPGSTVQHLHVDTQGRPGNKLAVNFGIDSISARNGATEVWPGSHRDSGLSPTEALDATGVVRPPSLWQPCCLCRLMVTDWLAGWLAGWLHARAWAACLLQHRKMVEARRGIPGCAPVQLEVPKGCAVTGWQPRLLVVAVVMTLGIQLCLET